MHLAHPPADEVYDKVDKAISQLVKQLAEVSSIGN
jgi:hypothetical protein